MTDTSTTSTTATDSGSAAPSSPGPSSPSVATTESRPATFDAAFAANPVTDGGDTVTPDAAVGDPNSDPGVAPITPPETELAPPTDPTPKGPIPFDRHEAILKNTRAKTQEETLRAVADEVRPLVQFREQFTQDRVGTLIQLWQEVEADPKDGPLLRSHAARVLRAGRQPAPAPDAGGGEMPQPDATDQATGETFYSPAQAAKFAAWQAAQAVREAITPLEQAMQPIQQERQQAQQEKAHRAFVEQQQTAAKTVVQALRQRPFFKENEKAIKQVMTDQGVTVHEAYAQVVSDLVPTLQSRARQSFTAEAAAKAAASVTTPGGTTPGQPRRPATFEEAFAQNPVGR